MQLISSEAANAFKSNVVNGNSSTTTLATHGLFNNSKSLNKNNERTYLTSTVTPSSSPPSLNAASIYATTTGSSSSSFSKKEEESNSGSAKSPACPSIVNQEIATLLLNLQAASPAVSGVNAVANKPNNGGSVCSSSSTNGGEMTSSASPSPPCSSSTPPTPSSSLVPSNAAPSLVPDFIRAHDLSIKTTIGDCFESKNGLTTISSVMSESPQSSPDSAIDLSSKKQSADNEKLTVAQLNCENVSPNAALNAIESGSLLNGSGNIQSVCASVSNGGAIVSNGQSSHNSPATSEQPETLTIYPSEEADDSSASPSTGVIVSDCSPSSATSSLIHATNNGIISPLLISGQQGSISASSAIGLLLGGTNGAVSSSESPTSNDPITKVRSNIFLQNLLFGRIQQLQNEQNCNGNGVSLTHTPPSTSSGVGAGQVRSMQQHTSPPTVVNGGLSGDGPRFMVNSGITKVCANIVTHLNSLLNVLQQFSHTQISDYVESELSSIDGRVESVVNAVEQSRKGTLVSSNVAKLMADEINKMELQKTLELLRSGGGEIGTANLEHNAIANWNVSPGLNASTSKLPPSSALTLTNGGHLMSTVLSTTTSGNTLNNNILLNNVNGSWKSEHIDGGVFGDSGSDVLRTAARRRGRPKKSCDSLTSSNNGATLVCHSPEKRQRVESRDYNSTTMHMISPTSSSHSSLIPSSSPVSVISSVCGIPIASLAGVASSSNAMQNRGGGGLISTPTSSLVGVGHHQTLGGMVGPLHAPSHHHHTAASVASSPSSLASAVAAAAAANGKGIRNRVFCGECVGCLKNDDCGRCRYCQDKTKFGGQNRLRQKCLHRRCLMDANRKRIVALAFASKKAASAYSNVASSASMVCIPPTISSTSSIPNLMITPSSPNEMMTTSMPGDNSTTVTTQFNVESKESDQQHTTPVICGDQEQVCDQVVATDLSSSLGGGATEVPNE